MIKKKKNWQRWKEKPLIDIKEKTLKEKKERVEELMKEIENEESEKNDWKFKKFTPKLLQNLKICFSVWMTDEQACYFCEISPSSFYEYQKVYPKFLEWKGVLKQSISLQSRINIWKAIRKWSVADSWKRLEKKDSSFIPKIWVWWVDGKELFKDITVKIINNGNKND